jgi:hypothetical protein
VPNSFFNGIPLVRLDDFFVAAVGCIVVAIFCGVPSSPRDDVRGWVVAVVAVVVAVRGGVGSLCS